MILDAKNPSQVNSHGQSAVRETLASEEILANTKPIKHQQHQFVVQRANSVIKIVPKQQEQQKLRDQENHSHYAPHSSPCSFSNNFTKDTSSQEMEGAG